MTKLSLYASKLMSPVKTSESNRFDLGASKLKSAVSVGTLVLLLLFIILLFRWALSTNSMQPTQFAAVSNGVSLEDKNSYVETALSDRTALISGISDIVFEGNNVYVQNYERELLLTQDGGKSWLTIGGEKPKEFDALTFTGGDGGWAVDNDGKIWKTVDGGHSWDSRLQLERQDPEEHYMSAHQIVFNGPINGWVVEIWAVWRTQDGGLTWNEVNNFPCKMLTNTIREMYFLNSRLGWTRGEGVVLQTLDGGENWNSVTDSLSPDFTTDMNAVYFLDENRGWISVSDPPRPYAEKAVVFTNDGGRTWQAQRNLMIRSQSTTSSFWIPKQVGWWAAGNPQIQNLKPESSFRPWIVDTPGKE